MGRPPSNGAPAFRFTPTEVAEMETILQEHHLSVPSRDILTALAEKFSKSADRSGQVVVQMKQVWNWFQNRRYAVRAKLNKSFSPAKLSVSTMPQKDPSPERRVPQPVPHSVPQPVPQPVPTSSALNIGRNMADNAHMEFEAKSARDGAWYDVATFLSHRYFETGDPEVLVRFSGFGPEEDEWVNVRRLIRQRSLPCESSECVAVLPGDLILCFQEGNDQALYFDAHVLDAQRRRHDIRGCRCRFLVRYDHDQSEEIVPLRKVCRRPETDYRLQQLRPATAPPPLDQHKTGKDPSIGSSTAKDSSSAETTSKQHEAEEDGNVLPNEDPSLGSSAVRGPGSPEMMPKQDKVEENAAVLSTVSPPSQADNASVITGAKHLGTGNGKIASTGSVENSDVNSGNAALTNGVIISSVAGGSSEA